MNIVWIWWLSATGVAIISLGLGIALAKHNDPCELVIQRNALRLIQNVQGREGNWNYDPYMRGLFNGLELSLATLEKREPEYRDKPPLGYREEYAFPINASDPANQPQSEWDGETQRGNL